MKVSLSGKPMARIYISALFVFDSEKRKGEKRRDLNDGLMEFPWRHSASDGEDYLDRSRVK